MSGKQSTSGCVAGENDQMTNTDVAERPENWVIEPTKFMYSYEMSCRFLQLNPLDPRPFPGHPFCLRPHQVRGIQTALVREHDAFEAHILADDSGLGKTCQLLHVIYYSPFYRERKEYHPTLVLASLSTCLGWIHDAAAMFPADDALNVVTLFQEPLSRLSRNFTSIQDLNAYYLDLKPQNPLRGRLVILTTYETWIGQTAKFDECRHAQRRKEQRTEGKLPILEFHPWDFKFVKHELWFDRVILDDGDKAKVLGSKINAVLSRMIFYDNLWFVSATALQDPAQDILGITMLFRERMNKYQCHRNEYSFKVYAKAYSGWHSRVQNADDARIYHNENKPTNEGWFQRNGATTDERYGLYLLYHDHLQNVLTKPWFLDRNGHPTPYVVQRVVGYAALLLAIRQTKDSVEVTPGKKAVYRLVPSRNVMAETNISFESQ